MKLRNVIPSSRRHPSAQSPRRGLLAASCALARSILATSSGPLVACSFLALGGLPATAFAGADVRHYDLDLKIDPATVAFDATADVVIEARRGEGPLTSFTLDFVGFTLSSATWSGGLATIARDNGTLTVTLAAPLPEGQQGTLTLAYTGVPQPYISENGNLGVMQGKDITFTINVTDGARFWFPCRDQLDDKATVDLALTLPTGYESAGPGHLVGVNAAGAGLEKHQWSMAQEVTPYLISFAFSAEYQRERFTLDLASGPLIADIALLPEQWPGAWGDLEPVPDMLDWLEARYGVFPYDQMGMHEVAYPGCVEQPGNISVGSFYWTGNASLQVYFAHELAHSWFQGLVTIREWNDIFLDESIASWHELTWTEQSSGIEAADTLAFTYLEAYLIGAVDEGTFSLADPDVLFGYTTYMKGAVVWRLLEHLMGREALAGVLRTYLTDGDGIADLDDFFALIDAQHDPNLAMFREEWIERAGLPSYRFGWRSDVTDDGFGLALRLAQDSSNLYTTPIEVQLTYADGGVETVTLRPNTATHTEVMCIDREVVDAQLDPRVMVPRMSVTTLAVEASATEECGGSGGCGSSLNRRMALLPWLPGLGLALIALRRRRA